MFYRNPKAPWPNKFLSSIYSGGEQYDIDWPEFNKSNQSYLNLGEYISIA